MPRPYKYRRVCKVPKCKNFHSEDVSGKNKEQKLTLEEFETIRLIDYEGMTQEECAAQMLVARTTVQRIYNSARKKTAAFLVLGGSLIISGGNYEICGDKQCRGRKKCCRCLCRKENIECDMKSCKKNNGL